MLHQRLLNTAVALIALAATQSAQAETTYSWTNGSGSSTWDAAAADWTIGGGNTAWVDDVNQSAAVFDTAHGAVAGTVTVSGTRSANSLTFGSPGYTLSGGTITLGGASPNITAGADAVISSGVAGSNGLVKSGSGTLTLSGPATYTGPTVINNGTLRLQAMTGGAYTLPSNTVAYWNFDDSANLGNDSGPNGNTLVASGAPTYTATGKHDGALNLDGGSCLVPATSITGLPVGNDSYTIAAWLWLDPTSQNSSGIVGWGAYGGGNQVNAFRTNGAATLVNYWWSADLILGTPNLASAWHHVAATTDVASNTRTIYVDGMPVGSDHPGDHAATADNFAVGRTAVGVFGLNELLKGQLDDVLIANRALSQTELQSLMNLTVVAGTPIPETTAVQINTGATLDLNGVSQSVASLADGTAGGGTVTNSAALDATLMVYGTDGTTFSGVVTDGLTNKTALSRGGTGTLVLSGASTYSGGTSLNGGILAIGADSIGSPVTSGPVGTGPLMITGGAVQAESAAHTLGNAVVLGGDVIVGGSQDLTLAGSVDLGGGDRRITVNNTGSTTISGTLGNTSGGFFYKDGPGTLTVTGAATVNARLYLERGAIVLSGSGSWTCNPAWMWQDIGGNDGAGTQAGDMPTLTVKDSASFSGPAHDFNVNEGFGGTAIVNLQDHGTITVGNTWLSKNAATAGIVNQTGGTFTVNGTLFFGGNGGGNGTYNLNGGTLTANALVRNAGATAALNFGGGTLQAGADLAIGDLPVTINAGGAVIDTNGKAVAIQTVMAAGAGNGGLIKKGIGTLTISVPATYAGPTVINQGVLKLQGQRQSVNPMGFYAFDDSADLGKDSTANNNTLAAGAGSPLYSADGKHGGSLDLNGASTLVPAGALVDLPIGSGSYTIAAWMFLATDSGTAGLVGWGNYGNDRQVNAFRTMGPQQLLNYWWGADLPSGVVPDMRGTWHHVACTADAASNTRTIYIDGVLQGVDHPGAHSATADNFAVGKTVGNEFFTGRLDDLLIANRAISQTEIQTLMTDPGAVVNATPLSDLLPAGTAVQIADGAALDLNSTNQTVSGLTGPAGALVGNTGAILARLTFAGGAEPSDFGGTIQDGLPGDVNGPVSLSVSGGELTLSGMNTFSGGTNVEAGTLTIANAEALPVGGSLTIGGGTGALAANAGAQAVPEPGTLALLAAAGLIAALAVARRKAPL